MERPALTRLLAEIDAGKIDVVVVYKVDRLTRSLGDFARIVERFDKAGVSFVSVTQAFNTTSSMGRLTLNVLLSFAQFEREVTGERIRDKIAASKRKGMWMGGLPPLGYDRPTDPTTRALVVNRCEAETVRTIFERYLALGSVHRLITWLESEGIRSKCYDTLKGDARGGQPFSRGAIFHLLRNRLYVGEMVHKGERHPGAHAAIVDAALFDKVQSALDANGASHRESRAKVASSPLKGVLFDADSQPMSPAFARGKSGRRYRYYVSTGLQKGVRAPADDVTRRISAAALESLLTERLRILNSSAVDLPQAVASGLLMRVDALPNNLVLTFGAKHLRRWKTDPDACLVDLQQRAAAGERIWIAEDRSGVHLSMPVSPRLSGGRTRFLDPCGRELSAVRQRDLALIRALRTAHGLAERLTSAQGGAPITSQYERNLVRLSCLAPDIQRAIFGGTQPTGLTLQRLVTGDLPLDWDDQRRALGFV